MTWRALVLLVTLAGATLRLAAIDFALPDRFRPDEQYTVDTALWLGGRRGFNPHFAEYPAGQTYLVWALAHLAQTLTGTEWDADVRRWYLTGRLATAAMGVLTIPLTAAVTEVAVRGSVVPGVAALARPAGALAAALMAGAFLHVRDSHFATIDVPVTCWSMALFLALAAVVRHGRTRDALVAGVLLGLAVGTKYPAVVLAVPVALAHALRLPADGPARVGGMLVASAAAALLAFFVATPFVILDYTQTIASVSRTFSDLAGHGFPAPGGFGWVWGTGLPVAIGWPLVGLTAGALVWAVLRGSPFERLLAAGFVITMLPLVFARLVFIRYVVPLLPLGMVLIAAGVARLGARRRVLAWLGAALALAALVPSLARVEGTNRLLARDDTRTIARRWMEQHLPRGTTVYSPVYGVESIPFALPNPNAGVFHYASSKAGAPRDAYVLLANHALQHAYPPTAPLLDALAAGATLLLDVNPVPPGVDPHTVARYEPADAFFVPLDGFGAVSRPGPRLRLYRLTP